jgi:hypothetical protein
MLDHNFFLAGQNGRSASDQFFTFINLSSWLLDQHHESAIGPVKEGSDPAAAAQQLLTALSKSNFDIPPAFTTTRLQSGSGEEVCGILNGLVDWALEMQHFDCAQPIHPTNNDDVYDSFTRYLSSVLALLPISRSATNCRVAHSSISIYCYACHRDNVKCLI